MMRALLLLSLPLLLAHGPARAQGEEACAGDRFLSRARQLTFEGRRAGEGYWSPDGSKLVFQSERTPGNPFYQIFVLDLESGETRQVSNGVGKTTCAFFGPDGNTVLYASTHHDPQGERLQREELEFRASGQERRYSWDYDPQFELYLHDLSLRQTRRITGQMGYDAEGSLSPDGEWVVYTSNHHAFVEELDAEQQRRLAQDPAYFNEIWIRNSSAEGHATRLTSTPGYDGGPFFTPDGERIVWRRFDEEGLVADIYTMRTDGSDEVQVTDFASMSWAPYMHASGEYILFASNKQGFANFELYMVDTAGTREPVRVTCTDGFDGLPVPSPDGEQLAWTSNRGGGDGAQIWLAQWDHEAALAALQAAPARTTKEER